MRDAKFSETEHATEPGITTSALLSEVAATLLRVPFEERTRSLHIRALKLKRDLDPWDASNPSEAERKAARDNVLALRSEAVAWLTRSG